MSQLKTDMLTGVFWSAVEKYSGVVVGIIISMILARILHPEDFGIVAIATVLIFFLEIFCTLGIGPAVIQRRDLDDNDMNSIFSFSLYAGFFLSLILFAAAWPIAKYYGNDLLEPICKILSVQLFFSAANMVPNALMYKNKKFKEIASRTLVLQVLSGTISVLAAFGGAGIYALLISPVFTSVGIFLWNRRYYRVTFKWSIDWCPLRKIFSFSSYQFLFEFVNYFSRNLDKLIIGKMINMDALGAYEKSYRLMQQPLSMITSVIDPVMLPVLKDLQDDKTDLANKYNKIIRFVSTISFPTGVILSGCSCEIITILYGNQWEAAVPVFRILALSIPLMLVFSTSGAIYMVCNNTKMQFWLGIRNTITTVSGFLVAGIFLRTIEAMAWAWVVTLYVNFAITFALLYKKVLISPIKPMLLQMIRPFFIAVILFVFFVIIESVKFQINVFFILMIKFIPSIVITFMGIQILKQFDLKSYIIYVIASKIRNR